jgi:hypothetical protein
VRNVVAAIIIVTIALLDACGGGASTATPTTPTTPTTPANRSPTITSVTVTPAFGVSGLTTISMSATATDLDNDPLTYQWTFGSSSATGPTVAVTMTGDGNVPVQVIASDGKGGTATDSRTVTIGTMTGRWTFIFTDSCGPVSVPLALPVLTLTQLGRVVTGDLASPAAWCNVPAGQTGRLDPAAPATIDDQGNFSGARLKIGAFVDTFITGKMDSTGRKITGTTRNPGFSDGTFQMIKQ